MTSGSFAKLATVTASTKRASISSGKRGTPSENISSLSCTPLDPVDPRSGLYERLSLETPHELLQTFVDGSLDIEEGDILVVGSDEYPIKAVGDWAAGFAISAYKRLILEELKR